MLAVILIEVSGKRKPSTDMPTLAMADYLLVVNDNRVAF